MTSDLAMGQEVTVMERRQFLGTLLAGLGAMAIPKTLLWEPTPQTGDIIIPGAIVSLKDITARLLLQLSNRLGVDVPCVGLGYDGQGDIKGDRADRGAIVGTMTPNGPCSDHLSVTMELEGASKIGLTGLDEDRYVIPMADAMMRTIGKERGAVVGCGRLALPLGMENSCRVDDRKTGLSLRGIHHYWYLGNRRRLGSQQVRFDILLARK